MEEATGIRAGETVERYDRIEPLAEEWDALVSEVGGTPFLRPGWIERAWRIRRGSSVLGILALRREGRLAAVLPFHRRRNPRRLGLRTVSCWFSEWVGEGIVARDPEAARALLAALLTTRPASATLATVDFDPALSRAIEEAATGSGYRLLVQRRRRGPVVDFSWQSLEEYRSGLDRKFSKELRRCQRRLQEMGSVTLEVATTWDEGLFEEGLALEAAGWKGRAGTAILSRSFDARFYREIARWAGERGILVLAALRAGERRVAFELGLLDGGVYYALKGGYDPTYASFSPGNLLTYRMLEWVSEHGQAYEFLGDAESYKLRFSTRCRTYLRIDAFRPTPAPTLVGHLLSRARAGSARGLAVRAMPKSGPP